MATRATLTNGDAYAALEPPMPDYHISEWIRTPLPDSHWLGPDTVCDGDGPKHFDIYSRDGQFYHRECCPDGETYYGLESEPFPSALAAHIAAVKALGQ